MTHTISPTARRFSPNHRLSGYIISLKLNTALNPNEKHQMIIVGRSSEVEGIGIIIFFIVDKMKVK